MNQQSKLKMPFILSQLQLELLKLYANDISEEQLFEIKLLLANFFAKEASDEMDKFWKTQNLTQETMIEWTNEHYRANKNCT